MCCRELVARFANDEMCRITEALIFQDPYSAAEAKNKWTAPHLDADVEALQADEDARAAAGRLQVSAAMRRIATQCSAVNELLWKLRCEVDWVVRSKQSAG